MSYQLTTATKKLSKLRKRIRGVAGGTSAGKTISILQLLIDDAQTDTAPTLTSIVSETFPHLRRGCIRDFLSILQAHDPTYSESRWEKTNFTYTFPSGSKIEFFSADMPSKVRGPRRDRLFVNEVNNIPEETWTQLLIRTREYIWADWNPTRDFFFYEDYVVDEETKRTVSGEVDFEILTYKDNEALEPAIVAEIERRRSNKNWFKVYGEGKRGEIEQKIFTGWKIYDSVPHEARLEVGGGDFGYARDPNAFCHIYRYNGGFIIDELLYRVGMQDTELANTLLNQSSPNTLYIADSSDMKAIDTLRGHGVNITGVEKKGRAGESFTNGAIKWVQSQQMGITKSSINYIKSYRNFMWQTDKDGNIIPKYDHYWSDGMMSVVYGMTNFNPERFDDEEETYTTGNIMSLYGGRK